MSISPFFRRCAALSLLGLGLGAGAAPAPPPKPDTTTAHHPRASRHVGNASIYARRFAGRKMANGAPMDPRGTNAASRTLPLGTSARVTNLRNGRSAVVTIEDRGPHVRGRIIDLSPATARQIGLTRRQGVAPVEVAELPPP